MVVYDTFSTNGIRAEDVNAYLIITCEGEKVSSAPIKQTSNPEMNFSVIFYRRSPESKPINIDVWHKSLVMDDFIGRVSLRHPQMIENQIQELALTSKKDKDTPINSGSLIISTSNNRNLMAY
ncbi:hypothetical protein HELRODRAFT_174180 [Helobdella robusta]|uniref:C2 domain-containing protein n=1 Tax=Helobdella robusta TaxID=6412 RepID=T1F7R0_HELRO|nr:hypothetical protein HELRODRAFT_174180 [Helobdella robusta]ESO02771.1 hypothetical protein HELRODRAFT_174180 [Helobdella robusta]